MSTLTGDMLTRVIAAIGKEPPLQKSVTDLSNLSVESAKDLELIYQKCGSVYVFAYLRHVSNVTFDEVRLYVDNKGWHESAD